MVFSCSAENEKAVIVRENYPCCRKTTTDSRMWVYCNGKINDRSNIIFDYYPNRIYHEEKLLAELTAEKRYKQRLVKIKPLLDAEVLYTLSFTLNGSCLYHILPVFHHDNGNIMETEHFQTKK
ncbi:MAG: hypothetical protein PUB66_06715 [Oscillospiraceae bacterium]|nr:hypothetical protein [Oscillospiraceae bacterium]